MVFTVLLAACSSTKYVPDNDHLYLGAKVKIDDKDMKRNERKDLEEDLGSLTRPKPNTRILGIPIKLLFYNMKSKSGKGIGSYFSRKFGEPPVLYSTVKVDFNLKLLANRMENKGYFRATDTVDSNIRNKKASLTYHIQAGPQYMISSVGFTTDSSDLGRAISATAPQSLLKVGNPYDLDVIKLERERIDAKLKEQGFYYFGSDYLIVQVDSTNNKQRVDLLVTVKNTTPAKAMDIYTIRNIYIYPNYKLRDTSQSRLQYAKYYDDFYVIDSANLFKPSVFSSTMFFDKGDVYNRTDHNLSLNRLMSLGTFRFVKNRFEEADSAGRPMLDAFYQLTPYPKKSIKAEVGGHTNSANFTGSEFSLSWRNRNAFRGAELLTFSAYIGTDVQVSAASKGNDNLFRFGAETSLNIPRFITPFKVKNNSAYIPRTKMVLGFDDLTRQNSYILNSFRTSLGYVWRQDAKREHQLNVVNINYVQPFKVSYEYDSAAATNLSLRKAIEKQFIFGPDYNFNFTNTAETFKKNTFYFNFNAATSGNILGLAMGANKKAGDPKTLFGAEFSQYVRFDNDFRHYMKVGRKATLASRIVAGIGLPYGNSLNLPYIKQFFIGGSNSIRAFRARSLGPGTYHDPNIGTTRLTTDQAGDIKLELNTEYRPTITGIVKGALFIDAGNIWLMNNDPKYPKAGGVFSKNFMKELAVGTGAGLRFDLSFLVLRTDLAFPLRKPWLPEGERWVLDEVNFGSKSWRKENLIFNLAIGYPF
ncbi:MAG: hypothetical protein K0S09_3084 [Sphingobacteriaceae bacterium]|jgi:outer membrane protein assembly factor BamA|nr:hypothetical protein [Sphingobacteriaceae bacterium]